MFLRLLLLLLVPAVDAFSAGGGGEGGSVVCDQSNGINQLDGIPLAYVLLKHDLGGGAVPRIWPLGMRTQHRDLGTLSELHY